MMVCPACHVVARPGALFCQSCGEGLTHAMMSAQDNPMVPIAPTLVEEGIVPVETSRTACVREIGDIVKVRDVIGLQSRVVCDWLVRRQGGKGVSIKQEISVGGRVWRRTLRASVVVKTW